MLVVGIGLAIGILAALGRTVMLQTKYGDGLKREAANNYVRTRALDDWRGDIVDRNGGLMGVTVHRWALTADPQLVVTPALTATVLAELLETDPENLEAKLTPKSAKRALEERLLANPPARKAHEAIMPYAKVVSDAFGVPMSRLSRSVRLLEYFYQMEQLQVPGVHKVARILSRVADEASRAIAADEGKLRFFSERGRRFAYLGRDLDDEKAELVASARTRFDVYCAEQRDRGKKCDNPLRHVFIQPEAKRYYPKREVGAQLVGLVGADAKGISGVELALDGLLSGGDEAVRTIRDRRGRDMFLHGIPDEARFGAATVELTLDEKIQAHAERALAEACLVSGARGGFAVVMDVRSGEILAAANFPTYNPNTYKGYFSDRTPLSDERRSLGQARDDLDWAMSWPGVRKAFPETHTLAMRDTRQALSKRYDAFVEHAHNFPDASRASAFLDVYEPGSITKIFTVAAALDAGTLDLNQVFDLENGEWQLDDPDETKIHDTSRLDEGTVALIIKKSSNIGAAKVGFELGAERLEQYMRRFGFGSRTGSGFPGEAGGLLLHASEWGTVELANISFGQGFAATGIQLVGALSALANDGVLMRPRLVRRLLDPQGNEIRRWEPEAVHRVVSAQTARTVLDLMKGVIEPGGTGRRAYIPKYPVAGKTGTGQKSHLRKRGYAENMWVNTFFGVAPADAPELAIVVLVDEPKGQRHGGGVFAAPAFRDIMSYSLEYLGISSPFDVGSQVAWLEPQYLEERRAMQRRPEQRLEDLRPPIDASEAGDVPMPDFRGMTMDHVRREAQHRGLRVRYVGSGLVRSQDRVANERYPVGELVTVTLEGRSPMAQRRPIGPAGPSQAAPPHGSHAKGPSAPDPPAPDPGIAP